MSGDRDYMEMQFAKLEKSNMKMEILKGGGTVYETPSVISIDVISEGLLCASTSTETELETYDFLEEQLW